MRHWQLFVGIVGLALILPPGEMFAQQSTNDLHLKTIMTTQEFAEAGLSKLSAKELAALDKWLNRFTDQIIVLSVKANASAQAEPAPSSPALRNYESVIESNIDGSFHGWDGETIFKLTNGQIWQQSQYDYTYEYAYRPSVTIYKTSECWKMKVEDVEDTICVKRIR